MVSRRTAEWRLGRSDRVRVLIEDPDAQWFHDFERYRCSGVEVAVCTGPDAAAPDCPHLKGRRCELWEAADAVVFALPRDEPTGRLVLKTGRRDHPGKPIVFDLTAEAQPGARTEDVIDGRVAAVREALRRLS